MKKAFCFLMVLCMALPCAAISAEEKHLEGSPWINSSWYGNWPGERPGPEEDFALYANFDFFQDALSSGKEQDTSRASDTIEQNNRDMVALCLDTSQTGPEEDILRTMYALFNDTQKREEDGLKPLLALTDRVRETKTTEEFIALLGEEGFLPGNVIVSYSLAESALQPGCYGIMINRMPALEDIDPSDEELAQNPEAMPEKDINGALPKLVSMGFGPQEAAALAEKAAWFETECLYSAEPVTEREAALIEKGTLSLAEVNEICPLVGAILRGQGMVTETETDPVYCVDVPELMAIQEAFTEENLDMFKAVAALCLYNGTVHYLTPSLTAAAENIPGYPDGVSSLLWYVPTVVLNQAFLHHFVPQERIEAYFSLVEEYREAMRERVEKNTWLDAETKKKVYDKLADLKIVDLDYFYGEFDCEALRQALRGKENILEAASLCAKFDRDCLKTFVGKPVRRENLYTEGNMFKPDGIYNPYANMFMIGASGLTGSICDWTSRETVLGTLGAHLAHELSHGYDTYGAQFDVTRQAPLWTEADGIAYMNRANEIAAQLGQIEFLDGEYEDGQAMIGEALADLMGVRLSLDIAKNEENFDYDAFFKAFAGFFSWYFVSRENWDPVHPAPYVRINFTLQHMDEFYETYPSAVEGTPMYMPPEERELIW